MTSPRYAELAARAITEQHAQLDAPTPSAARRARMVAAIERALGERRRRLAARRRAFVIGLSAAAGAVAASVAFVMVPGPAPSAKAPQVPTPQLALVTHPTGAGGLLEVEGRASPLVDGETLVRGSRIVTRAGGGAVLALSTGTKLTLDENARLSFEGEGNQQLFSLSAGAVDANVAKLSGTQRFVVRTSDAEVEVRGTAFRVSEAAPATDCGGGATTRVAVSEGLVIVRFRGGEFRVAAGEVWPSDCSPARTVAAATAVALQPTAPSRRPARPSAAAAETYAPSQLAEQNDYFARAMAARRSGQNNESILGFDLLLAKYPRGPLAESATVERLRVLHKVDPSRVRSAGHDYLARYPNGFARSEVKAMLEVDK